MGRRRWASTERGAAARPNVGVRNSARPQTSTWTRGKAAGVVMEGFEGGFEFVTLGCGRGYWVVRLDGG